MKKLQAAALFCTLSISTSALLASDQGAPARLYLSESGRQIAIECEKAGHDFHKLTSQIGMLLGIMDGGA